MIVVRNRILQLICHNDKELFIHSMFNEGQNEKNENFNLGNFSFVYFWSVQRLLKII